MLRHLLLGMMLVAAYGSAHAEEPLPMEYFFADSDYEQIKISPDGEYLALRTLNEGQMVLMILDRDEMSVSTGIRPERNGNVDSFYWTSNERLLYTISLDVGELEATMSTGELYGINRDGSQHDMLFGARAADRSIGTRLNTREGRKGSHAILSHLPDDPNHIVIAVYPWKQNVRGYRWDPSSIVELNRLNVYTGNMERLGALPTRGARGLADEAGQVRFSIGENTDGEREVFYRESNEDDWEDFDLSGQGLNNASPVTLSDGGNAAYVLAEAGEDRMISLYRLDLEDESVETVSTSESADISAIVQDIETDAPVGAVRYPDRVAYSYFADDDNQTVRLHRMLRNAFPNQAVSIVSKTDGGDEIIVEVASDVNSGEFYLFDSESLEASYLMARDSWINPEELRPMEPIELEAEDGTQLSGYITRTADADADSPLVVLPHGGPHQMRDYWGFDSEAQFLAHHGYNVLQVNFRGSPGYGEAFKEAGYGEWGDAIQSDIADATRWAIEQGYADGDRVCIYGASFGGYSALMSVIREPSLYQCALGLAGVYDMEIQYQKSDMPGLRGGENYMREAMGMDEDARQRQSPVHRADAIEVPVYLAHGEDDERVPVENARAMRDAIEKAGGSVTLTEFSGEAHGLASLENRKRFYGEVLDFLDEQIGSAAE